MDQPGADEKSDGESNWEKNQREDPAKPETHEAAERVVVAQRAKPSQQEAKDKVEQPAYGAADHAVEERISHSALGFHASKGGGRIEQDEL